MYVFVIKFYFDAENIDMMMMMMMYYLLSFMLNLK